MTKWPGSRALSITIGNGWLSVDDVSAVNCSDLTFTLPSPAAKLYPYSKSSPHSLILFSRQRMIICFSLICCGSVLSRYTYLTRTKYCFIHSSRRSWSKVRYYLFFNHAAFPVSRWGCCSVSLARVSSSVEPWLSSNSLSSKPLLSLGWLSWLDLRGVTWKTTTGIGACGGAIVATPGRVTAGVIPSGAFASSSTEAGVLRLSTQSCSTSWLVRRVPPRSWSGKPYSSGRTPTSVGSLGCILISLFSCYNQYSQS